VHGVSDMQQLGKSIAFLRDLNGDGVPDYVAGAPANGFSNPGNGHAVVISGADGSKLFEFDGAFDAQFGVTVENAGDVDGDGVDDVAVGARKDGNGAVYVYSGATHALVRTLSSSSTGSFFGNSLANLGDLDGDGVAELAVGAPYFDTNGVDLGLAVIYSGASGGVVAQWTGATAGGGFGSVVGDAGDVDGDGVRDLLVVAQGESSSGGVQGVLHVYSGAPCAPLLKLNLGAHTSGWNASGAGDVDGDGLDDVIVCNVEWPVHWDYTIGDYDNGGVWVYSSTTGKVLAFYKHYHHIAGGIGGVGDLDGDGFGDFAFGTGEFDSKFLVISGKTLTELMSGSGIVAAIRRGVDVNGDGVADIAVGMPDDWTAGVYAGIVKIFDPVQ